MLTNVVEIDQATYIEALRFNAATNGNLLVFGQAGIGKTEIPQQIANQLKIPVVYWNLSTQEAPDLVGLPMITKDGAVEYAAPRYMPLEERTEHPVIVLIDEIDKCKPELQNPLLEVLQSHTIMGRKLKIQSIVATGNLPDENAHSQPVSHALTNRCMVFKLTHSFEPWRDWAQNAGINPLVIGFLSKNQEFLSRPPVEGDATAYCRPSPRSWSQAARQLDATSAKNTVAFQTMVVAGRVGSEAAVKFQVWLEYYRHVEPIIEALADHGTLPSMNDMTIDKQIVCAIGAVSMVAKATDAAEKTSDRAKAKAALHKTAANVFKWVKDLPSEFQMAAVKSTLKMELITKWELTEVPDVMTTYQKVRKAMVAK